MSGCRFSRAVAVEVQRQGLGDGPGVFPGGEQILSEPDPERMGAERSDHGIQVFSEQADQSFFRSAPRRALEDRRNAAGVGASAPAPLRYSSPFATGQNRLHPRESIQAGKTLKSCCQQGTCRGIRQVEALSDRRTRQFAAMRRKASTQACIFGNGL